MDGKSYCYKLTRDGVDRAVVRATTATPAPPASATERRALSRPLRNLMPMLRSQRARAAGAAHRQQPRVCATPGSPTTSPRRGRGRPASPWLATEAGETTTSRAGSRPADDVRRRRHRRRRRRAARLHLRHHRPPKATMHFHRDVLADRRHVLRARAPGRRPDDVFTGTPPLAFTFGLGGLLVFPLRAGASTLLVEKATPVELADLIDEHGVTVCFTAPTAYKAMLARRAATAAARRCARRSPPASTCRRRPGRRSATRPASRSSTASARPRCCTSSSPPPTTTSGPGATGRAVPGYRATVLDDDGQPAARRRRRAGWPCKGPTGCRYLADPRQAAYVQNGWNLTGDTFVPRRRRLLLVPGPQRRHDHLLRATTSPAPRSRRRCSQHPDVAECAVVGVPDEDARAARQGVRRAARTASPATPRRSPSCRTSSSSRSRRTSTRARSSSSTALPRTRTGKVQRFRLREPQPQPIARRGRHAHRGHRRRPGRAVLRRAGQAARPGATRSRVWERNAADDTFGFGVVFSDETLGGIEHADPVIHAQMAARVRPLGRHRRALPRHGRPPSAATGSRR